MHYYRLSAPIFCLSILVSYEAFCGEKLDVNGVYRLSFEDPIEGKLKNIKLPEFLVRVVSKGGIPSNETYILNVLHVYKDADWRSTTVKEGIRNFIQNKVPVPLKSVYETVFGDESEIQKSANLQIDEYSLTVYTKKTKPKKIGTWRADALQGLAQQSVNLLNQTKDTVAKWTASLEENIKNAKEHAYKFGYTIGHELAKPALQAGEQAALNTAKAIVSFARSIENLDLISLASMLISSPSELKQFLPGLDVANLAKEAITLTVSFPDLSPVAKVTAQSIAKGIRGLVESTLLTVPSFFKSEPDFGTLKENTEALLAKFGKLSGGIALDTRRELERTLNEINSITADFQSKKPSEEKGSWLSAVTSYITSKKGSLLDFMKTDEGLLLYLQLRKTYENAKTIYDAEQDSANVIANLAKVLSDNKNTFSLELKGAFFTGLRDGAVSALTNGRIDLREVTGMIDKINQASILARQKLGETGAEAVGLVTDTSKLIADPGVSRAIDVVKRAIGFSGKLGFLPDLVGQSSSASEAILRVMIRGFR